MSFLSRQSAIAALTVNAVRPSRGQRSGVGSFAAGFVFNETAPQLLALVALDAAAHLTRGRRKGLRAKAGLALAGASALGLARMVQQSRRAGDGFEEALVEGLGVDYVEQLDQVPTPADLATSWRRLTRPFSFADDGVRVIRDLVYSEAGRRGHLDIYLPAGEDAIKDAPVLLQVHGGAWSVGAKEHQGRPLMNQMAAKGWVCVAINYRLVAARRLARPHRRRQARHRLGQGQHRRLRRRPGLPRHHRRLGRRSPDGPGRADPRRPGLPARLRGRRHACAGGSALLRRL